MKPQINSLLKKARTIGKKALVAGVALTCFTATAFASGEEVNSKVINSLKKDYQDATNVAWKVTPQYIKASFTWNDQDMEVFYNEDGETIAISRFINENNLPLRAQKYIRDNYADYNVSEAIEFNNDESGTCFYVSLTKDATKKILKISSDGGISNYRP